MHSWYYYIQPLPSEEIWPNHFISNLQILEDTLPHTVLLFDQAVGLWIEGGREFFFDIKEVTKRGSKLGGENCSSVTNNRVRKAVMPHYYVDNFFRKAWGIDSNFN